MYEVVSFDIFDTCLVRSCGTPDCFFDVLSTKVFDSPADEDLRQAFIAERLLAERKANEKMISPRIQDIYGELVFKCSKLKPVDEIVKIELSLEKDVLLPVHSMKEIVDGWREKGVRIIFISDMYIPGFLLQNILQDNGFFTNGDKIYVSCDYNARKVDGRLYDIVQEEERVECKKWLHYGDNAISDFQVPKSKGISAKQVSYRYNYYPTDWLRTETPFNFRYGSILAGLSRAFMNLERTNERSSFILDIVAPLYCSFCCSVMRDAKDRGIRRLYFCARDMFHVFNIAKVFSEDFPGIELRYLYISRHSLENSDSATLLKFFEQEGLASRDYDVAIVDCSSTGNTLDVINDILLNSGYNGIYGYYLIKYDRPGIHIPDAWYTSIIREGYSDSPLIQGLLTHVLILESMMSSNTQKRTDGYQIAPDGVISPVFNELEDEDGIAQENLSFWEMYYSRLLSSYAFHYKKLNLVSQSKSILEQISLPTLLSFFSFPVKDYTSSFENVRISLYNGRKDVPYLLGNGSFFSIFNQSSRPYWRRGTIVNNLPMCLGSLYSNGFLKRRFTRQITSSYKGL